jgi:hypothetical protein
MPPDYVVCDRPHGAKAWANCQQLSRRQLGLIACSPVIESIAGAVVAGVACGADYTGRCLR